MGRYVGKYCKKKRIPLGSWLLVALAVLSLTVGGVVAYLSASTDAVENKFVADASTDPAVIETFRNNEKTNVVVDVGDPGYAVYVRAAVVVTWKNKIDGDVWGVAPEAGVDYTIDLGDDWFPGSDGFYYYTEPVAYDGEDGTTKLTTNLIDSCAPVVGKAPETDYTLNVEIIAQTIQALGTTDDGDEPAVTAAWGVTVVDGKLKPGSV